MDYTKIKKAELIEMLKEANIKIEELDDEIDGLNEHVSELEGNIEELTCDPDFDVDGFLDIRYKATFMNQCDEDPKDIVEYVINAMDKLV